MKTFMAKWLSKLLLPFLALLFFAKPTQAAEIRCKERYLTLINPVRGRDFWADKSVTPLIEQYNLIKAKAFSATWLLQYEALADPELIGEINNFDSRQEVGLFLEITEKLTRQARIFYPPNFAWANPRVLFLSGYSRGERRKIIDYLFKQFKSEFGFYPKSVGAWWIDSYSLDYMKKKYGVKAALIVADQRTTDNYGVWGQWWGVSYYPSKRNILQPAHDEASKEDVVIVQWAQRHPDLAWGDGPQFSNYSLQANDYISLGKNTSFFEELVDIYSDCTNPISQVTVGLETGIESSAFLKEYKNQLDALHKKEYLESVTLSEYSDKFRKVFPSFPTEARISGNTVWEMNVNYRKNEQLGDFLEYSPKAVFADYYEPDGGEFLNRRLPDLKENLSQWHYLSKNFSLFNVLGVLMFVFLILFFYLKRKPFWIILVGVSLGILAGFIRASYLSGKFYLGFSIDAFRFVGFSFEKPFRLGLINQDFYNLRYFLNPKLNNFLFYTIASLVLASIRDRLAKKR